MGEAEVGSALDSPLGRHRVVQANNENTSQFTDVIGPKETVGIFVDGELLNDRYPPNPCF